jgi:hypothetical protein
MASEHSAYNGRSCVSPAATPPCLSRTASNPMSIRGFLVFYQIAGSLRKRKSGSKMLNLNRREILPRFELNNFGRLPTKAWIRKASGFCKTRMFSSPALSRDAHTYMLPPGESVNRIEYPLASAKEPKNPGWLNLSGQDAELRD